MKKYIRISLTGLMLGAAPGAAEAQWVYTSEESAFGNKAVHIAMTVARGGYGFGLRCNGPDLEALFLTPEKIDGPESVAMMTAMKPAIKVRVDDRAVRDFTAVIDASSDSQMIVRAEIDMDLVEEIRDAKRRVSVAFEVVNSIFHETQFNVRSSTSAAEKLINACNEVARPPD